MEAPLKKKRKRKPHLPTPEKKRRKSEHAKKMRSSQIMIGDQIERWKSLQEKIGLKTNTATAKFLLDRYTENQQTAAMPGPSGLSTSTPLKPMHKQLLTIQASEISSVESDTSERTLTGVESIADTDQSENGSSRAPKEKPALRIGRKSTSKKKSDSFLDPFELSIDISQDVEEEEEHEEYDSDYEPSFAFTAVLPDNVNRETADLTFEEVEFGMEMDEEIESAEVEVEFEETVTGMGITRVQTEEECERLTKDITCLVFLRQILELANTPRKPCQECGSSVHIDHNFIGSALYLKWICAKGHAVHKWCSQPVLNRRLHSGDFLSALSIVSSGNNYGKVALLAKLLNLQFLSSSTFHRIQLNYLIPTVDDFWKDHQAEVLSSFRDKGLIVLGDGRMDSPGHSAQYCSYTVMENESKKILTIKTLDKRQTDRKSVNMEKKGFVQCMESMEENDLTVTEVVTDAHLGIGALMKSQYPNIKHSNDVWHAAKNLGKKILKAGQRKGCGGLLKWSKHIVNHFWFCCKTANTYPEFMSIWRSLLHHITDQHSWVLSHGDGINKCYHEPLTEEERDKPWLNKVTDKEALSALAKIILDKRFLNRIHYLLNFRSTAMLETFNQLILMYCAKRFAYTPPAYRMRNLLAAIDHNMNVERPLLRNKKGDIVYNRYYNKKSGRWSVFPKKVEKSYLHIRDLSKRALTMRLRDNVGMKSRELEQDDPRRMSRHLAPVSPPPTHELVQQKVSRFSEETDN